MKNKKLLAVFAALTVAASSAALTSCDVVEKIPVVGPIISGIFGKTEAELKSIKLDAPDKTTYVWGEAFDPAGMVVTATYSDGTTKEIPEGEYTMSIAKGTKLTENVDLVVTYQGMTAKKTIRVTNPATSIEIVTHATKLRYIPGQSFDPTGLVLAVKYTDGTQREIVVAEDSSVTYSKDPLTTDDARFAIKVGDVVVYEELSFGYGLFVEAETALINAKDASTPTDGIPSTSGGMYVGNMFAGESISFLFTADKAGKADIAFVLASLYLKKDSQWSPMWMGDCQFNLICEVYVNGEKIEIPDSVILPGGGSEDNEEGNADLWTNWQEVTFDNIDVVKGANSIKLKFIPHNYTDTSQASFSGKFTANIDCLTVNTEDIALTKLEAEDLIIDMTNESMELEKADDKAYIVLKGSVESTYPECELIDALDAYVNGYTLNSDKNTINGAKVTLEGNKFVVKLDVSEAAEGSYTLQLDKEAVEVTTTSGEKDAAYRHFTLAEDGTLTVVSTAKITDYKPTSVKLEESNGSVYFVIEGTAAWEGYESANDAKAALLPLLRFDVQGDLAAGKNDRLLGDAEYYDITFTAGENSGTYVMKICVDSLTGSKYSTHFGEGLGDLNLYNPLTQLVKDAVDTTLLNANHKNYQLVYEPEYSSKNEGGPGTTSDIRREHYFGCVGLYIVSDGTSYEVAVPTFNGEEVMLVREGDKPIVKIVGTTTITTDGYTLDEVAALIARSFVADGHGKLNSDGQWNRLQPTNTVCELTAIAGVENGYKFVVKMDLSENIYKLGNTYMVKVVGAMETSAENKSDLKLGLTVETDEQKAHATQVITVRDKKYTLMLANEDCWTVLSYKSEANPDWNPSITWADTTSATLENVDGKAYLVIERDYTVVDYIKADVKDLAEKIAHDFERISDWSKPSYNSYVVVGETSVKHYLELNEFEVSANPYLIHYDKASGIYGNDGNFKGTIPEGATTKLVANGKTFTLSTLTDRPSDTSWANGLTAITVSEVEGYEYKVTGVRAEIKAEGDKVLYVIHGTLDYQGYTAEEAKAKLSKVAIDFQENPYATTGSWEGNWAVKTPVFVSAELNADGTYVATYDITNFENFIYTGHYAGGDFKPADAYDQSVTVGGKVYRMFVVPGSGDGAKCWGCVGLEVKNA